MAKANKTMFFCQECGYESSKWQGQCPGCKAWNTFVEEPAQIVKGVRTQNSGRELKPVALKEVSLTEQSRVSTGMKELDRVLGGGIVRGSLLLVGGDPGIGKSTILLQVCRNLSAEHHKVLYISGE